MGIFGINANHTDLVSNKLSGGIVTYNRSRLLPGIFRTDTLLSPSFSSQGYAGAIYYLSFYSIWLLRIILSLKLIFSKIKYKEFGFSVLYIPIHLLKGAG